MRVKAATAAAAAARRAGAGVGSVGASEGAAGACERLPAQRSQGNPLRDWSKVENGASSCQEHGVLETICQQDRGARLRARGRSPA